MRWTLTTRTQTYGPQAEVNKYAVRVTRSGTVVRVSVENLTQGILREGHFSVPFDVARTLGSALLLAAAADTESLNVVFPVEEAKAKKT